MGKEIRYATFPLDCDAKRAANEYIAKILGSPRKLREDEYKLRELWMDVYIRHGGKTKSKPQSRRPGEPIDTCVKPPPDKPEPKPPQHCSIIAIRATCEHSVGGEPRFVDSRELKRAFLEVVPDTDIGYDLVKLNALFDRPCGEHPEWEITDQGVKKGHQQQLKAYPYETNRKWIPTFKPRIYEVICRGCNRDSERLEIRAYPPTELSFKANLTKIAQKIKKVADVVEEILDTLGGKFEWKLPEGKISISAQWKEYKDHRAYYGYTISINCDPLIGAEGEIYIGPGKITKIIGKLGRVGRWIERNTKKVFQGKLFLKASGVISADIRNERQSPSQELFVRNTGAGVKGTIGLSVGGSCRIAGGTFIELELQAGGAISAKGDSLLDATGVGVTFTIDFDGVKGSAKVTGLWGIIEFEDSITLIGPRKLFGPESILLYSN